MPKIAFISALKCRVFCIRNLGITKSFLAPIMILVIHLIATYLNVYIMYPWFDIPMHFFGGAAVAFTFSGLVHLAQKENLWRSNHAIEFLFVVSLVALTAILWEFVEFSL